MKKRFALFLTLSLLLLVAVAGVSAHGNGNTPAHLWDAGWSCQNVPGLGVHCFPPGTHPGNPSMTVKVYDTDDPFAEHAPFLGTELLLRADTYESGEPPCPQEGTAHWHLLDFGYYACHHS